MSSRKTVKEFKELQKKIRAYEHALTLMEYDSLTGMPRGGAGARGDASGVLYGELYQLNAGKRTKELLQELLADKERLDAITLKEAEVMMEELLKLERVPQELVSKLEKAKNDGNHYWRIAKAENDFQIFLPYLRELLKLSLEYAQYVDPEKDPYDVFLDKFEKGLSQETLEPFFARLRAEIVPCLKKIRQSGTVIREDFIHLRYEIGKQKRLSEKVMEIMGVDRDRCTLGETEHPFTLDFGRSDVRITTKYVEDDMLNNLFSVIHESGHAQYELHVGEELDHSVLGHGSTTAIHESQSRMWENGIARSRAFAGILYEEVRALFPEQLQGVTEEEFYRAINIVRPDLIRTEADELTYSLHVMVRYELEKKLFHAELDPAVLPEAWNRLYDEYLGVSVPEDRVGVLQDAHWAGGAFGYFPGYALGNAYSAQILHAVKQHVDLEQCANDRDYTPMMDFMTERMYRYGRRLCSAEILLNVTGEPFNPDYYIDYLKSKYYSLYGIRD
ncbi:MAG: carboxypeptidase M32 [Mogibacterium sp.]|nr:carboxypeptidase M32 [Mogibacterium sp.]